MKIIQLMPEFEIAGAEIMCENLTHALIKLGHEVVVVSMYNKHTSITDRFEKAGIKIVYLHKKSGFDISIIGKIRRVFKQENPDVIHTHRYLARYAIPAAVFSGVKRRVHTLHSVATKEVGALDRKLNNFFYRHLNMYPVAISPEVKKTIVDVYKLPDDKIGVVNNGIDISKCIQKQDYNFSNEIVFLHVGRFQDVKNHFGIIRAFSIMHKQFPNTRLRFYGQGELEGKCKELVASLDLTKAVDFCGTTDKINQIMHESDAFLLCSHYEGMPMTLIEAMSTGLPIVATRVGGIVDMIDDEENGFLCDDNEQSISNAMIRIISVSESYRRKMGESAIAKAACFTSNSMAKGYLDIYKKLV